MKHSFLDFEQPIAELEAKIEELRFVSNDNEINISEEIARLEAKSRTLTASIFSDLSSWQIAQLARHPHRPHTPHSIHRTFTPSDSPPGHRPFPYDPAIAG